MCLKIILISTGLSLNCFCINLTFYTPCIIIEIKGRIVRRVPLRN